MGNTDAGVCLKLKGVRRTSADLIGTRVKKHVAYCLTATEILITIDCKLSQFCRFGAAFESDFEIVGSGIQTRVTLEIGNTCNNRIGGQNATFFHDLEMTTTQNLFLRVFLVLARFLFAQYFIEKTQLFTLHG